MNIPNTPNTPTQRYLYRARIARKDSPLDQDHARRVMKRIHAKQNKRLASAMAALSQARGVQP